MFVLKELNDKALENTLKPLYDFSDFRRDVIVSNKEEYKAVAHGAQLEAVRQIVDRLTQIDNESKTDTIFARACLTFKRDLQSYLDKK